MLEQSPPLPPGTDNLLPGSKEKSVGLPLGLGVKRSLAFLLGDLTGLRWLFGAKAALVTLRYIIVASCCSSGGSVAGTEIT